MSEEEKKVPFKRKGFPRGSKPKLPKEVRLLPGRPKLPDEIRKERAELRKERKRQTQAILDAKKREDKKYGKNEPFQRNEVVDFDDRLTIKKTGKFGLRFLWEEYQEIRAALEKINMTWQESFDYLIVSGIIYLKPELINLVRSKYPAFAREQKAMRGSRISSSMKGKETRDRTIATFLAYKEDLLAFDRWAIEENVKKAWVVNILFRELVAMNPILLNHITRCKELHIRDRKKNVARLSRDELIEALDDTDAAVILSYLTKRYNERKFGSTFLEEDIVNLHTLIEEEKQEETLQDQLNKKIAERKAARTRRKNKEAEPLDENEMDAKLDESEENNEED